MAVAYKPKMSLRIKENPNWNYQKRNENVMRQFNSSLYYPRAIPKSSPNWNYQKRVESAMRTWKQIIPWQQSKIRYNPNRR